MQRVKLIIFAVIAAILAGSAFFWFSKSRTNNESEEGVLTERDASYQEIFATGKIKPTEELRLSFQRSGLVSSIYVKEGEAVERGQSLVELDTEELQSRLKEAEARLSSQESNLVATQAQLENAREALLVSTRDSYTKIEDALNKAQPLFEGGTFGFSLQEGAITYKFNISDFELRYILNTERKTLADLVLQWEKPVSQNKLLEEANLAMARLERVRNFIEHLSQALSHLNIDKTTIATLLDNHRSSISNVQSSISSAIFNLDTAKQDLVLAEKNVSEAGVEQVKREIETLQIQIRQTRLLAPSSGTILTKQANVGEVVQPGETVFTFYPAEPFEVEAEIYEGDIGQVMIGQKAQVEFTAYPGKTFEGQVIEIDRHPVLIDGVVHYLATLEIIEPPDLMLAGMSVDVRLLYGR